LPVFNFNPTISFFYQKGFNVFASILNLPFMKSHFLLATCLFFAVSQSFGGYYIEFKVTSSQGVNGKMKAWYQDGNTRSQMIMDANPGRPGMPGMVNMSTLHLQSQPDKSFMLNDEAKTYTEIAKTDRKENEEDDKFEITVIGSETVNGYACTHVTLKGKSAKGGLIHWWVSKDVKGYTELKKMKTRHLNSNSTYKALEEKGVEGFPVRIKMGGRMEMQMDLVKAEQMDIPPSKFSLDGLTKQEGMPMLPGGLDVQKLQNMSPAERQKFMEQMQKQYGKQQE